MIKLGGLIDLRPQWLGEADVYTATSKETGTTSVFKSKAARDAAVKAGTHEKRKDDKDGAQKDPTDTLARAKRAQRNPHCSVSCFG